MSTKKTNNTKETKTKTTKKTETKTKTKTKTKTLSVPQVITYQQTDATVRPVVARLEDIFEKLNERFFENTLELPVITVSPDTTKGAYGWMTTDRRWKTGTDKDGKAEDGYFELNVCAEHLQMPLCEVIGTLLHEMCHLYNILVGIKDTSRNGWYHNEAYKACAEAHGLTVEKDNKYGWCKTTLNDETKAWLESLGLEDFRIHRRAAVKKQTVKGKNHSIKYTCPNCGNSVRATKSVSIMCMDCKAPMLLG